MKAGSEEVKPGRDSLIALGASADNRRGSVGRAGRGEGLLSSRAAFQPRRTLGDNPLARA